MERKEQKPIREMDLEELLDYGLEKVISNKEKLKELKSRRTPPQKDIQKEVGELQNMSKRGEPSREENESKFKNGDVGDTKK